MALTQAVARTEMTTTLVLGGARSGKSLHAEGLVAMSTPPWIYVATAEPQDSEMAARIRQHQGRRSGDWLTRQTPLALAETLVEADLAARPVLVDCLTLWVSNLMHAERDVSAACDALEQALALRRADTVFVTNEVGLGIVPDNALARRFRDEAGRVNQRLAKAVDHVVFMVAGLPMTVK